MSAAKSPLFSAGGVSLCEGYAILGRGMCDVLGVEVGDVLREEVVFRCVSSGAVSITHRVDTHLLFRSKVGIQQLPKPTSCTSWHIKYPSWSSWHKKTQVT